MKSNRGTSRSVPHDVIVGAAAALTATLHLRAVGTYFAQDDIVHLARAAGLAPWNGLSRPLSEGLAFWLQYQVFGLEPLGYHVVNLALHLLSAAGVYMLALRLGESRLVAGVAAILFGCSSIAFTSLHWATGIVELLACVLLLSATLVHLESQGRGSAMRWLASLIALCAMLSKETAISWVLIVAVLEWPRRHRVHFAATTGPAVLVSAMFALSLIATGYLSRSTESAAYATTLSPTFLVQNLLTYIGWSVAIWRAIPDRVAAMDPGAWVVAVPAVLLFAAMLWRARTKQSALVTGLGWWIAFLLPVLPLTGHTYLYYLYIPWIGGAIAIASLAADSLAHWPPRRAFAAGILGVVLFVTLEARSIAIRASATQAALPVDATLRQAMILRNALSGLRRADLPAGCSVGFVNPSPGERFDLMSGTATRIEDVAERNSYWPLEGAMHDGLTLRLFAPGLNYRGFSTSIPTDWVDVECFRFEQRGWLQHWGRGQDALLHQARVQAESGNWASAESSLMRVRLLGDTIPEAVAGQIIALQRQARRVEADSLAAIFFSRWPASALDFPH